jgi:hypothetical protein
MLWLVPAASAALPPDDGTWSTIQETPVRIVCTEVEKKPYCRSTGVIGAPVATATATFETLDQHQAQMGAISKIERLEPDVLHIVMDYPFPLKDRDYVARFAHRTESDGTEVFAWTPVVHPSAPATSDAIRLTWLEGEWRFTPDGSRTRVTYVWQADPGGSIPDVGAVRKQAGTLAIRDLAKACGTSIVAP